MYSRVVVGYDKEGLIRASHRLIVGDFNFREIDWDTILCGKKKSQRPKIYRNHGKALPT